MKKIKSGITLLLEKFKTSDHLFMIIIPIIIGLLGGLGAIVLRTLIHFFQAVLWGNENYVAGWLQTVLVPAGGAFVVSKVQKRFGEHRV